MFIGTAAGFFPPKGEMAEWSKAPVSKTGRLVTVSRVQIPLSPHVLKQDGLKPSFSIFERDYILPTMPRRLILSVILAVIAFALLIFFAPRPLYAHLTGLTLTATTSNGYIDIDYDTFDVVAGEPGRFTLRLFKDEDRKVPIDFSEVWVRIGKRNITKQTEIYDTVFNGWIAQPAFGSTGVTLNLTEPGEYTITTRYAKKGSEIDDDLAEATLPFTVLPPLEDPIEIDKNFWTGFGIGALTIAALGALTYFIQRRR